MARPRPRRAAVAALAVTALLLLGTLTPTGSAPGALVAWRCVACTSDGGADFVANVAAFAPIGVALVAAGVRVPAATLAGLALSTAIELVQATGIPGRTAVAGDVLANALGTALGAALAAASPRLRRPARTRAAALAAVGAVLWGSLMTASAWLLGRDASPGPRPPRVRPFASVPNSGWYHGRVAEFTLDGSRTGRADTGPLVVTAAVGRRARGGAELRGGDERPHFVAAAAVVDGRGRPVLLVGQRGPAAELRWATRGQRWRLRAPPLVVPGALADAAAGDSTARALVDFTFDGGRAALRVKRRTRRAAVDHGGVLHPSPALGWALVVPAARAWGPERPLLDALWAGALLVPVGYWTRLAVGRRRGAALRVAGIGAAATALGLVAGPALAGAAVGTTTDLAAGLVAFALGAGIARTTRLPGSGAPASLWA